jgi:hypothetical protein
VRGFIQIDRGAIMPILAAGMKMNMKRSATLPRAKAIGMPLKNSTNAAPM